MSIFEQKKPCENSSEEVERLQIEFNSLDVIMQILKGANVENFNYLKEKEGNLKKILLMSHIQPFLRPDEAGNAIMGLQEFNKLSATVEEKAEIKKYVQREVPKVCDPILNFMKEKQKIFPDILSKSTEDESRIMDLDQERFNVITDLIEAKFKKCQLLKRCAELRVDSHQTEAANSLLYELKTNLVKIKLFQDTIAKEATGSRNQKLKAAIAKIEKYLDQLLLKDSSKNTKNKISL